MTDQKARGKYVPGTYVTQKLSAAELAEKYILDWEKSRLEAREGGKLLEKIPPSICFSRQIGVGALEIARLLAEKIGYRVMDKEILEYIAAKADLSEKTVALFDERYPGKLNELIYMAFGEKSFIQSDYTNHLFSAVIAAAGFGPTIFVGRGAHLILPRERVLAVRFIASKGYRIERIASMLYLKKEDAGKELDKIDKDQRAFFKKVFGKTETVQEEFDLILNFDCLPEPRLAVDIVSFVFVKKFGSEITSI